MSDRTWEPNPNWRDLPAPEEGDIVQLKHSSGFNHLVKAIVSSVAYDEVSAVVEAVFDWEGQGQITGGEVLSLVGKELTFRKSLMQNVIKKPDHMK
jgi:hypothetical protein